ncbi:MAG: hypothetical protein IT371_01170 [Deltaproteobacteria bacterium]|nr:hypothetical protein [Deltaproteobacteria bacterium]
MTMLSALLLVAACGGGAASGNRLFGSAETQYDLVFDAVQIHRQESRGQMVAMIVTYLRGPGTNKQAIPVKVVANAPVAEGQEKDLMKEGALTRVMQDASQFSEMKSGKVIFDTLGGAGSAAKGRFYVTFVKGSTLNGEFSGTVELLQ